MIHKTNQQILAFFNLLITWLKLALYIIVQKYFYEKNFVIIRPPDNFKNFFDNFVAISYLCKTQNVYLTTSVVESLEHHQKWSEDKFQANCEIQIGQARNRIKHSRKNTGNDPGSCAI